MSQISNKQAFTYFGVLRAPTSWAKVGRHMTYALIDRGCDINIYERKGFLYNSDFRIPDKAAERITQTMRDDVIFTFEHPQVYDYLKGRLKVGLLTYESTKVPLHWAEGVNRHLDLLLLPSTFCCDIFSQAGVPKEKTALLPYGFDPEIYFPNKNYDNHSNEFRFLTVASPHKREGVERVIEAYRREFSSKDYVSLTVKVNYVPSKKTKPFEYSALSETLKVFSEKPGYPKLNYISDYKTATELANLYRESSCLVSATRGEGFGMVFLEAAACGLPIIVTGWGGHMDFVTKANARLVNYKLCPAAEMQYDCDARDSLLAEADIDDLAKAMRDIFNERSVPEFDRQWLREYTWPALADRFIEICSQ